MPLATIDSYLEQIDELIRHASDYGDMEFRLRLEELVKKGGRDTENAIVHYINGTAIGIPTRLNLIRLAGYIGSQAFLLPLKKVIETGGDDLLREEAIVSISKYSDRRALDILASALDKIKNPRLQDTINQAIARVKHNNPLLIMLPRFLRASENRELFQITLKIFKKILGPTEAKSFISYLHHGDLLVAEGSFEILCFRGNETVFFFVAEFFRERSRLLARGADRRVGAARLTAMVAALHEYLRRHPQYFPQLRPDIASLRALAGDGSSGDALSRLMDDLDQRGDAQ